MRDEKTRGGVLDDHNVCDVFRTTMPTIALIRASSTKVWRNNDDPSGTAPGSRTVPLVPRISVQSIVDEHGVMSGGRCPWLEGAISLKYR